MVYALYNQTIEVFQSFLGTQARETISFESEAALPLVLHVITSVYPLCHLWLYYTKQEMAQLNTLKSRKAARDVERLLCVIGKQTFKQT